MVLAFFVIVSVCLALAAPLFLTPGNLSNVVTQAAPLVITSIGQLLVILTGGLDLSVGSLISLTTALVVLNLPVWAILLMIIGTAVTAGAVNGVGIAYFKVHPIIMTLASMSVIQGIALLVRPVPGGTVPDWLTNAVDAELFGLPTALIWIIVAVFGAVLLIYRSRFGLHLFAIGGGAANAELNGIRVRRNIVLTYILCSGFAAIAGIYLAGRIASGDAYVGSVFSLDSITAVALGGTSLSGGVGSLFGTLIGSLLVGVIGNGMNLTNVSAFLQTVVKGILLLLVVSIQRRKQIGL